MSGFWLFPATATLVAVVVVQLVVWRVHREAAALRASVRKAGRLTVALGDLDRAARTVQRSVADLERR